MALVPNEMSTFFIKLNNITYLLGLPNLWVDDAHVPISTKIQKGLRFSLSGMMILLIFAEYAAFFTQTNLTEKQESDRLLFGFSHTSLFSYVMSVEYHKERITKTLYELVVVLKEMYNDRDVERKMIRKAMYNATGFSCICMSAVVFYAYDGIMQVIKEGKECRVSYPKRSNGTLSLSLC